MATIVNHPLKAPFTRDDLNHLVNIQTTSGESTNVTLAKAFGSYPYMIGSGPTSPTMRQSILPGVWTLVELPSPILDTMGWKRYSKTLWHTEFNPVGDFYHCIFSVAWDFKSSFGNPLSIHRRKIQQWTEVTTDPSSAPRGLPACEYEKVYIPDAYKDETGNDAYSVLQTYMQPGFVAKASRELHGIRVFHNNDEPIDLVSIPGVAPMISGRRASSAY